VTAFAADLRGELAVSWKASLFIGNTLAILAASCGRALVILETALLVGHAFTTSAGNFACLSPWKQSHDSRLFNAAKKQISTGRHQADLEFRSQDRRAQAGLDPAKLRCPARQ
jgi:hypothetical protein